MPNETPVYTVNDARAAIFAAKNKTRLRKPLKFFGVDLEIQQPSVLEMVELREGSDEGGDRKMAAIMVLIKHAYLPGTDSKVFEYTDYEQLASMPFNSSFSAVVEILQELTNVSVEEKAKN